MSVVAATDSPPADEVERLHVRVNRLAAEAKMLRATNAALTRRLELLRAAAEGESGDLESTKRRLPDVRGLIELDRAKEFLAMQPGRTIKLTGRLWDKEPLLATPGRITLSHKPRSGSARRRQGKPVHWRCFVDRWNYNYAHFELFIWDCRPVAE